MEIERLGQINCTNGRQKPFVDIVFPPGSSSCRAVMAELFSTYPNDDFFDEKFRNDFNYTAGDDFAVK